MSSPPSPSLFGTWAETSTRVFNQMMEANRAAMSAFRPTGPISAFRFGPASPRAECAQDDADGQPDELQPGGELAAWDLEVSTTDHEGFGVGDHVRFSKTITEADVWAFAAASGDTNQLHLDEDYAAQTRFDGRIVHGTLVSGLISAALARLPGLTIYLSQDLSFQGPVGIGDRVTATVRRIYTQEGVTRYGVKVRPV